MIDDIDALCRKLAYDIVAGEAAAHLVTTLYVPNPKTIEESAQVELKRSALNTIRRLIAERDEALKLLADVFDDGLRTNMDSWREPVRSLLDATSTSPKDEKGDVR